MAEPVGGEQQFAVTSVDEGGGSVIRLHGQDPQGRPQSEDIVLEGTTPVMSKLEWLGRPSVELTQ